jgi:hypothetical protein
MKVFHTSKNDSIQEFDFSKIGSCGGIQCGEGIYFSSSLAQNEYWMDRLNTQISYEVEIEAKLLDGETFGAISPQFMEWLDASGLRDAEGYLKESILNQFASPDDALSVLKSRYYKECTDYDGMNDGWNIVIWNAEAIKGVRRI